MESNRNTKRSSKHNGTLLDVLEDKLLEDPKFEEKDILTRLHRRNLGLIEKEFPKEDGLSLEEFVTTLLKYLDYTKDDEVEKVEITLNLIDLFKEIDVNGDEQMEWEEFSNYIIELGKRIFNIINLTY